ncbi:hypothetical protein M885DRAFT_557648 [Pelagophyceae sp. CCMP2097]|nr:hypothetical protein M885DRAFT_557648 [Pelagophyceae sp. CCMP2097]
MQTGVVPRLALVVTGGSESRLAMRQCALLFCALALAIVGGVAATQNLTIDGGVVVMQHHGGSAAALAEAATDKPADAKPSTPAEVRALCAELRLIEAAAPAPAPKGAACPAVLVTGRLSRVFLGLPSLFELYVGQSSCRINIFVSLSVTDALDAALRDETTSCLADLSSVRAFHVADGTKDDAALLVDMHPHISRRKDGPGLRSDFTEVIEGVHGVTLLYQWKRIFEANVLRTRYELESGEEHNVVLYSRPDIAYFAGGKASGNAKFDVCALAPEPRAFWHMPCANWAGGLCDQVFAAAPPTMTRIATLYYLVATMYERGVSFHPESLLGGLVKELRLEPTVLQLPTGLDAPGRAPTNPECAWSTGGFYIIR